MVNSSHKFPVPVVDPAISVLNILLYQLKMFLYSKILQIKFEKILNLFLQAQLWNKLSLQFQYVKLQLTGLGQWLTNMILYSKTCCLIEKLPSDLLFCVRSEKGGHILWNVTTASNISCLVKDHLDVFLDRVSWRSEDPRCERAACVQLVGGCTPFQWALWLSACPGALHMGELLQLYKDTLVFPEHNVNV